MYQDENESFLLLIDRCLYTEEKIKLRREFSMKWPKIERSRLIESDAIFESVRRKSIKKIATYLGNTSPVFVYDFPNGKVQHLMIGSVNIFQDLNGLLSMSY